MMTADRMRDIYDGAVGEVAAFVDLRRAHATEQQSCNAMPLCSGMVVTNTIGNAYPTRVQGWLMVAIGMLAEAQDDRAELQRTADAAETECRRLLARIDELEHEVMPADRTVI
jgi:hypothetical protein